MKKAGCLFFAALLMLLALCGCYIPEHAKPSSGKLGAEMMLRLGEAATISSEGLSIRFMGIDQDSRCPLGVECIWAGEVTAVVTLIKSRGNALEVNLTKGAVETGREKAKFEGYSIKLIDVMPYPSAKNPGSLEEERIFSVVSKLKQQDL